MDNIKSQTKVLPKTVFKVPFRSIECRTSTSYIAIKELELGTAAGTAGGANRCHVVMSSNLIVLMVPTVLGLEGSRRNLWAQLVPNIRHRYGSES